MLVQQHRAHLVSDRFMLGCWATSPVHNHHHPFCCHYCVNSVGRTHQEHTCMPSAASTAHSGANISRGMPLQVALAFAVSKEQSQPSD